MNGAHCLAVTLLSSPINGIACAPAASGHAAAAPPRNVMNSRRLSFDHLVGLREQSWRDGEAERPGGCEIDDQVQLGWKFDG